jgi:hypothetical protein
MTVLWRRLRDASGGADGTPVFDCDVSGCNLERADFVRAMVGGSRLDGVALAGATLRALTCGSRPSRATPIPEMRGCTALEGFQGLAACEGGWR